MKLAHRDCHALVITGDGAEIVRIRNNSKRGIGWTVFARADIFDVIEYQEELGVYLSDNGHRAVHVLQMAATPDELPRPENVFAPDSAFIAQAIPAIKAEIAAAKMSPQMTDFMAVLTAPTIRVAVAHPFMRDAANSADALRLALKKMAAWETTLFSALASSVEKTIRSVAEPAPEPARRPAPEWDLDKVAFRVSTAPMRPAPARSAPIVAADAPDPEWQAKEDLKKLLSYAMEKIGEIDNRLLNQGIVPEWRDAMNDVFTAAMQTSRHLDYGLEDEPRSPRLGR